MSNPTTHKLSGRLDGSTAAAIETELLALLNDTNNSIDLDLSALDYVSSAGLRILLLVAKAAKAKGGKLVLHAPKPAIHEVFKISGFDRIIAIAP